MNGQHDWTGTVGIVSVATNLYLDYWKTMVQAADRYLFPGCDVTMHVFTDRPEEAAAVGRSISRVQVSAIEIPGLGWPEATLDRYQLISEHADVIRGDLLGHLDADMEIVDDVGPGLRPDRWPGGLAFVRHPGFYRSVRGRGLPSFRSRPSWLWSDMLLAARSGGLGSWEARRESTAFVPRHARRHYVCGGVWFGLRTPILAMCRELADAVADDRRRGVVAVWHDESHLNRFASQSEHAELPPAYCYVDDYTQLRRLHPRIRAVDKGERRTR